MSSSASNTASQNPGILETLSSLAQGSKSHARKLCHRFASRVITTIDWSIDLSQNLASKATNAIKQHAMENIRRANETVDEAQKTLAFLKQFKTYVKQSLEARTELIKIEYQKKQEVITKTGSDIARTQQEIIQTRRWSLPGKRAKLFKKLQTLSASLAQHHGQAQDLKNRYSGLRTFYRRINTIDAMTKKEDILIQGVKQNLNPTPFPTTIAGIRALTASFTGEHRSLLAISNIEIGSLGLELTDMYDSIEKIPALKTHIF